MPKAKGPSVPKVIPKPCQYRFDAIALNVTSNFLDLCDKTKITVSCNFREWQWKLPQQNINVVDFPKDDGFFKSETIQELSDALEKKRFLIEVNYKGAQVGEVEWQLPQSIANKIELLQEAVYGEKLELLNSDEVAGCIEMLVHFQPICVEDVLPIRPDPACPHLEKLISPNDVIFVVGDPMNLFPCPTTNPLLKDPPKFKSLDMIKYRPYHGQKLSKTPSLPNTSCSLHCARFKEIAENHGPDMVNKLTCIDSKKGRVARQSRTVAECMKLSISPDVSESASEDVCCSDEYMQPGFTMPKPTFEDIKRLKPKICPICRTNIKYLPDLAACPICGYKPEPVAKVKPVHKNLSVTQVVSEYCDKNIPQIKCPEIKDCFDEEGGVYEPKSCQCTCLPGYVCPYCRVRKTCNVKSMKSGTSKPPKKDTAAIIDEVEAMNDTDLQERRPYLERIFSEMNDIYNLTSRYSKRETGGTCKIVNNTGSKMDRGKPLPTSTACKDIKEIRNNPKNRKIFQQELRGRKDMTKPKYNCKYKAIKETKQKCGRCNPMGCLPCIKPHKHKCGDKMYDYCTDRGISSPKRDDHRYCYVSIPRVPCDMGWLWNVNCPGRGWKPGAIPKSLRNLMSHFLMDFPTDTLINSRYCNYRVKRNKPFREVEQQTALEIEKKNNEYHITFRPLKDYETLKKAVDPFIKMDPMKFRIIENPMNTRLRELKECMFKMGYRACFCNQPAVKCCCRTLAEKKFLLNDLAEQCKQRNLEECFSTIVMDNDECDDPEDEYTFGITPPAGIVNYGNLNKPDYVHADTKYDSGDWCKGPVFPRPKNKFEKLFLEQVKNEKRRELAEKKAKEAALKDPLENVNLKLPKKKSPPAPPKLSPAEERAAAAMERIKGNPKLSKLVGKDGKLDMNCYLRSKPMLKGELAKAARMRRLRLLLEQAPMPFELISKRDRLLNSCYCGQAACVQPASHPCHPCCGPC